MKIIAVDTNRESLALLGQTLKQLLPDSEILTFSNPMLAVKQGINQEPDMVFTEIAMRGVDGLTLIKLIREHHPRVRVVFVTQTEAYGVDAMRARADGYLIKPVTEEKLQSVLSNARKQTI